MDQQRIKALIDMMADSDLVELNFSENNCTLKLVRDTSVVEVMKVSAPVIAASSPQGTGQINGAGTAGHTQCAPFYGVLHLTPAPGQPQFVRVGDRVEQGQTLGLLEAMKMFHPITAEHSGKLDAIFVAAGEEVDPEQPLFQINKVRQTN